MLSMFAVLVGTLAVAAEPGKGEGMESLKADPLFVASCEFADKMIAHGRDDYGERKSPLFATQLNAATLRIPAGTADDPGVWNTHFEVAGYQPYCQNLLSDLSLLDLLRILSRATGDLKYDQARRAYLAYVLEHTRDPRSGYIPWGEHVGYDIVEDEIHVGERKYWHEVKAFNIPWDQFWEVNPEATRHEIEIAFHNHLCDESTFAFNRHATMDGKLNTGSDPCSLSSSGGLYIDAWCWLYKKTGDKKFLEWAKKMNAQFLDRRSKTTGLFATDESIRKDKMVYIEAASYAPFLFIASDILGDEGREFRDQAIELMVSFQRHSYVDARDDGKGPGYYDAVNIITGESVLIDNKRYLEPWQWIDNHEHPGTIVSAAAMGYAITGDERLLAMFDKAVAVMDIPGNVAKGVPMLSGDAAGAIMSVAVVAKRSGDAKRLEAAKPLVEYVMEKNRKNGIFTSGKEGGENYYCARAGSGALAMSVLAYALASHGQWDLIPPIRDIEGGLRF